MTNNIKINYITPPQKNLYSNKTHIPNKSLNDLSMTSEKVPCKRKTGEKEILRFTDLGMFLKADMYEVLQSSWSEGCNENIFLEGSLLPFLLQSHPQKTTYSTYVTWIELLDVLIKEVWKFLIPAPKIVFHVCSAM